MTRLKDIKILITGVQGQVGFEMIKSLSTCGAELILASRNPAFFQSSGYRSVSIELSEKSSVQRVLDEVRPDLIVNAAAYTAVDKAENEPGLAFAVNCEALRPMLDYMRKRRAALIHFSTDYVYNSNHEQPNIETDRRSPGNVYASSKVAGEELLLGSDLPFLILRTSWVYGTNGSNFVKTMLKLGREREHLRIVADQVGAPTSAVTLAQAVASILGRVPLDPVGFLASKSGVYNLSDNGFTTWHEFALEIFRQARLMRIDLKVTDVVGIRSEEYPTPATRPLNSRLSLNKIADEFAIVPSAWQKALFCFLHQIKTTL